MKHLFYLLFFLCTLSYAQNVVRYYNLNVKSGHAESVKAIFDEFQSGREWKSGGIFLQAVQFRNDITHRVVVWGDPENWGTVEPRKEYEWTAYRAKRNRHIENRAPDSSMGTVLAFTSGDVDANPSGKVWDIKVENPSKFKAAWDKIISSSKNILGDRRIGLVQYDAGGNGATHAIILYGKNMNDLILTERKIRAQKSFKDYLENRGKVEYIATFMINTLSRF